MRFILSLLFAVMTAALCAQVDVPQGCITTYDSAYIVLDENPNKNLYGPNAQIYHLRRDYRCEDGRKAIPGPMAPIGDSAVLLNNFRRNAIDLSRAWANAVTIAAMKEEAVIKPLRIINKTTQDLFGVPIYPEITKEIFRNFPDSLFLGDFRLTSETGIVSDATITQNANGQLRLRWGTNNKQVLILSEVHLRVLNYSSTKDLDLVRRNAEVQKWVDPNSGVTLVRKKRATAQKK